MGDWSLELSPPLVPRNVTLFGFPVGRDRGRKLSGLGCGSCLTLSGLTLRAGRLLLCDRLLEIVVLGVYLWRKSMTSSKHMCTMVYKLKTSSTFRFC